MSGAAVTRADLRAVDLFDGLDDDDLDQWVAAARELRANAGDALAEEGMPPPGLLLLEGSVQTLLVEHERAEPAGRQHAPTWMGAISVLTGESMSVRLQADTSCRIAVIEPADFRRLVFAHQAVHERVMQQVTPVISRVAGAGQHRERLASLGTMAAGLAHELNNPAAAASRAASEMAEVLDAISSSIARFVESGVERAEAAQLVALQRQAVERSAAATALGTLDAADAEDDLLVRLQALGVAPGGSPSRSPAPASTRPGSTGSPSWPVRPPTPPCAGWPRPSPPAGSSPSCRTPPSACRRSSAR
jgi:CRP-like cAMP-binding protein